MSYDFASWNKDKNNEIHWNLAAISATKTGQGKKRRLNFSLNFLFHDFQAPSQKGFRSQLRGVCESLISASQVSQWADLCQLTQSCLESPSSESRELVEFLLFLTQLLEETLQDSQRRWLPVAREQFQLLTMLHGSCFLWFDIRMERRLNAVCEY